MSRTLPSAAVVASALLLTLVACGGSDQPDPDTSTDSVSSASPGVVGDVADDLADVRSGDVPDECVEAFPLAVEPADLADVTLRPAELPDPPVEGTLCQTSSTLDDSLTSADYATTASATEVLDAYETQLGATYDVVREDNGAGETLTGDLGGGVSFQVTPGEGRYSIAFGTS